jgi:dihydrofolate reductase
VHAFVNDLERPIGTYLYGRRMYEVMAAWETLGANGSSPAVEDYAGIWGAADKIVFSRTLDKVSSSRTRLEREFDPDVVRRMKAEAQGDMSIGGPTLASRALLAGLVDEIRLFLTPIVVGGGTRSLPVDVPVRLRLLDERRFRSGVVHLGYRVAV